MFNCFGHYNVTFCFDYIELMCIIWLLIVFHNSFLGIMKVVVIHGSLNRLTFKVVRKHVVNKSKSKYEIFPF
jgi:hypothetical protein